MMHIAYISHEYPPDTGKGGIGTYTWQMAQIMQGLGHEVEVFTASFDRQISEVFDGVLTHRIKIDKLSDFKVHVPFVFSLQHQKKNFQIIECPEIGSEAEFIHLEFPDIPLVVRLHTPGVLVTRLLNSYQTFFQKLRFVLGAFGKGRIDLGYWSLKDKNQILDADFLITEKASIITAPSDAMKDWAVKFWGIDPKRIKVIPNPYNPSEALKKIDNGKCHQTITFLGRLNVLKGLVALTKSIPKVLDKHPDWKFRIIGHSEQSHIKDLSMRQWMESQLQPYLAKIEFIDWIDYSEIPKFFAQTDIVVIPSLFESFSYVCVEAMSAGKAVAGSNNGGIQDLLADGRGLLFDPKNAKEIASQINVLIENDILRKRMGNEARTFVIENLNKEHIGLQTQELYSEIIQHRLKKIES